MKNKRIIIIAVALIVIVCGYAVRATMSSDNRFRFIVAGCIHFDGDHLDQLAAVIERMRGYDPDLVVFLGSIVDVVGENTLEGRASFPDALRAFRTNLKLPEREIERRWSLADDVITALGVPVYDVPSERNIPANNVEAARKSFLTRFPGRYYSFVHKNNLFIMLDSESGNRTDLRYRGVIEGEQLRFLKEALSGHERYDNVFAAIHKSVWNHGFGEDSGWFDVVHPIINDKVKYVFGACLHILDKKEVQGVQYITTAVAPEWSGQTRYASFPHFLVVEVSGKRVDIKVVAMGAIPVENLIVDQLPQKRFGPIRKPAQRPFTGRSR